MDSASILLSNFIGTLNYVELHSVYASKHLIVSLYPGTRVSHEVDEIVENLDARNRRSDVITTSR